MPEAARPAAESAWLRLLVVRGQRARRLVLRHCSCQGLRISAGEERLTPAFHRGVFGRTIMSRTCSGITDVQDDRQSTMIHSTVSCAVSRTPLQGLVPRTTPHVRGPQRVLTRHCWALLGRAPGLERQARVDGMRHSGWRGDSAWCSVERRGPVVRCGDVM